MIHLLIKEGLVIMFKTLLSTLQALFTKKNSIVASADNAIFTSTPDLTHIVTSIDISTRKVNQEGLDLIRSFEGLSLTSYPDDASPLARACIANHHSLVHYVQVSSWETLDGVPWTIGYGATGPDIKAGMTWTEEQCIARLQQELVQHETAISKEVTIPLSSNAFSALVSFCYNCGPTNLHRLVSGSNLNEGTPQAFQDCADRLLSFNKARGEVMEGLTRRRQAERELFLKK